MRHHLLTTGISLLENFRRAQNPVLSLEDAVRHHNKIREFLANDPKAASAEINSLEKRTGFLQCEQKDLEVTLIHTTTPEGKLVYSILRAFLRFHVAQIHDIPLKSFDAPRKTIEPDDAQKTSSEALTRMRQSVSKHILKFQEKGGEVELNCTAGYKAEIAVLYELGRTLRVPVYYLHETFKICVTLP
jgi:putative CRISPR-associated protein (TIGR02619 family)